MIYWEDPDDPTQVNPSLGNYLGDFTDECDTGDYIVEFTSGGPKNYGYLTKNGKEVCKVKGLSLNAEGSRQMNYELLKEFVLDEIERPKKKPRMKQIMKSFQIVRDGKNYELYTEPGSKFYQLVYDKRVIDSITKKTWPFGFFSG